MKAAQKLILSSFQNKPKSRIIPVKNAVGHIVAEPVLAHLTIPPVPLAGHDGIAIKSKETKGASVENPLKITGITINIGFPMPVGYDAVISPEEVRIMDEDRYITKNIVSPFHNVVKKGSETTKGQIIVQEGHVLMPYDVAALSHFAVRNVLVKVWRIGMIATGNEIIPLKKEPQPGEVVDTNTMMISGYLQGYGTLQEIFPIIPDDADRISSQITSACENCDMLLVFGGTSEGTQDCSVQAIETSGKLLIHGVAIEPGKTFSCGSVQGKPVFGMPGSPIACLITFFQFVFPLLKSWGVPIPIKKHIIGEITKDVLPCHGYDTFHQITIRYVDGGIQIYPMEWRFGYSMGFTADGILHLPEWSNGFRKGEKVQVTLIR